MTEYSPITDTQIESESPIDATLATQWRDNPIAITEGSAGAPKINRRQWPIIQCYRRQWALIQCYRLP